MTGPAILEARNIVKVLGKGAGEVRALKGVSVSLHGGELTLLMGPSGSGKTTLLSILGCILAPTEGEMIVAGNSTRGLGPEGLTSLRRQHIGFIFQQYNLFPTLSAEENVRLSLDVRDKPKSRSAGDGARCADRGRPQGQVPFAARPALGRPAAARGDRPRARRQAFGDPRRRTDGGARQRHRPCRSWRCWPNCRATPAGRCWR